MNFDVNDVVSDVKIVQEVKINFRFLLLCWVSASMAAVPVILEVDILKWSTN